jgi:hypothetical protein
MMYKPRHERVEKQNWYILEICWFLSSTALAKFLLGSNVLPEVRNVRGSKVKNNLRKNSERGYPHAIPYKFASIKARRRYDLLVDIQVSETPASTLSALKAGFLFSAATILIKSVRRYRTQLATYFSSSHRC